jgi:Protein of unknown function (DUF3574)
MARVLPWSRPERTDLPRAARRKREVMMQQPVLKKLTLVALASSVLLGAPAYIGAQIETQNDQAVVRRPIPEMARHRAATFGRTELFFGTARPGGVVSEEEFQMFVDHQVTPRFPDGLTVIQAAGQFTGADGILMKEDSFVLVLLYPLETANESHRYIEDIRRLYRKQFQQESVLRVDDPLGVFASF